MTIDSTDGTGTGTGTGTDDQGDDAGPDASVFGPHAEYVTRLRGEAAERRRKGRELETALEAANARLRATQALLVDATVTAATRGILQDGDDLLRHVDAAELVDEDGAPDPVRIKAAAEALAAKKPHLAPRVTVGGDVDQGARPAGPAPFDFASILRQAAG